MRYQLSPVEWLLAITISVGEDLENVMLVGMQTGAIIIENCTGALGENLKQNYHIIEQFHSWVFKETRNIN